MSRRWKKSISIVVLFSFIALLVPKSLWHDCIHQHAPAKVSLTKDGEHKQVFKQGVEKCSICDMHFPQLSVPVNEFSLRTYATYDIHSFAAPSEQPETAIPAIYLRGPPASV